MKVKAERDNVYTVTGTRQEIGALVAAARMAGDLMRSDPAAPPQALALLNLTWPTGAGRWKAGVARGRTTGTRSARSPSKKWPEERDREATRLPVGAWRAKSDSGGGLGHADTRRIGVAEDAA